MAGDHYTDYYANDYSDLGWYERMQRERDEREEEEIRKYLKNRRKSTTTKTKKEAK